MSEFKLARSSEHDASRRAVLRAMGVGAVAIGSGAALAQPAGPAGPVAPPSTVTTPPRDFSPRGAPTTYFTDPDILAVDPTFDNYVQPNSAIQRLWTGALWAEGPAWNAQGRYLLWSDIPNNRQLRWLEDDGRVSVFRAPSNNSNGNSFDYQGRQLSCEHLMRRVVRYELDGSATVLADSFEGKRLNSPNDVVVKSDGSIWFTDPVFGILGNYEGVQAEPELGQNVYRIDGQTGEATIVAADVRGPNGLAFSPDESILYLVESRATPNRLILAFDVDGRKLKNQRVFIDAGPGTPDGFRVDVDGNLWCGWGMGSDELDGVMVYNRDGDLIGRIKLPERCANVCFGGRRRNRLFMAASQSIYALYVNTQGAPGG
jgi:gluconolactonase